MSKVGILVLASAAALTAAVLLLLGWRGLHVAPERARTVRGRFLLAVAFFLAVFVGWTGRAVLVRAAPPEAGRTNPAASTLDESAQWKALAATWKDAEEVASGKRGPYPFDEAGKKKLLDDLDAAAKAADKLAAAGLLTVSEAGLLKTGLTELVAGVQAMRPTEMRNATCYEPMAMPQPAKESTGRLAARLPLLEQLWKDGKIHGVAVEKMLWKIDGDLAVLAKNENLERLNAKERAEAEKVRDAVKAHVDRLRGLLKEASKPTGVE